MKFKIIGYTFLSIVILVVLIIIFGFVQLYRSSLPVIHSDSQFVSDVQKHSQLLSEIQYHVSEFSYFRTIPDNAQDLYIASVGWLFPNIYISFRLDDKDQCEAFFMDNRIDLSKFEKGNLSKYPWNTTLFPINGPRNIRIEISL